MTEEEVGRSYARKSLAAYTTTMEPTYCGVPVKYLTKEELIKYICQMHVELERERGYHNLTRELAAR